MYSVVMSSVKAQGKYTLRMDVDEILFVTSAFII